MDWSADPGSGQVRTFTIRAHNNAEDNCYIQKAELNGKPLERCWFHHAEFANGGLLELWLGPEPNEHMQTINGEDQL